MKAKLPLIISIFLLSFSSQAQQPLKKLYEVGNKWAGTAYMHNETIWGTEQTDFYYEVEKDTLIHDTIFAKVNMTRKVHYVNPYGPIIENIYETMFVAQLENIFLKYDLLSSKSRIFFSFESLDSGSVVSPNLGIIETIDTIMFESENRLVFGVSNNDNCCSIYNLKYYYIDGVGFFHDGPDPGYGDSRWFESSSVLECFTNGTKSYSIDYNYKSNPYKPSKINTSSKACGNPLGFFENDKQELDFALIKDNELITKKVAANVMIFDSMGKEVARNYNCTSTSVQNFPNGVYVARINFGDTIRKLKFFKE